MGGTKKCVDFVFVPPAMARRHAGTRPAGSAASAARWPAPYNNLALVEKENWKLPEGSKAVREVARDQHKMPLTKI